MNERPNFKLNENAEYNEAIGKLVTEDPANAEIFNRVFSEALNNTHYTKGQLDKVKETADGALPASQKGAAGGVASLDSKGKLAQMPTAADVGAAPSDHNHDDRYFTEAEMDARLDAKADAGNHQLKTYTTLKQLGLPGKVSMAQICAALPNDSVFQMYTSTNLPEYITDPPANYSIVRAFAAANGAYCEAWSTGTKRLFVGAYRTSDTPPFSGWREVTIAAGQLAAMACRQAQQDVAITQLQQANAALMLQVAGGEGNV